MIYQMGVQIRCEARRRRRVGRDAEGSEKWASEGGELNWTLTSNIRYITKNISLKVDTLHTTYTGCLQRNEKATSDITICDMKKYYMSEKRGPAPSDPLWIRPRYIVNYIIKCRSSQ